MAQNNDAFAYLANIANKTGTSLEEAADTFKIFFTMGEEKPIKAAFEGDVVSKTILEDNTYITTSCQNSEHIQAKPSCAFRTRIKLRYDTEEAWNNSLDIVLEKGEVAFSECPEDYFTKAHRKMFVGDGIHSIAYFLENENYLII